MKKTNVSQPENIDELLDKFVSSVNKIHGQGSVLKMSDNPNTDIPKLHSGSILLNKALGGGYPYGRVIEVFGGNSSGKTSLCLIASAEVQKLGGRVLYIDAEHSLNIENAQALGVDLSKTVISQPDSGEEALDILDRAITSKAFKLIVIDSVAALTPKSELDGEIGDFKIGGQARLMSQACRILAPKANAEGCILMFVNQERKNINANPYQNAKVTAGGEALKYYASIRMEVSLVRLIKDANNEPYGQDIRVKVVKNKITAPFKTAELKFIYGVGLSAVDEVVTIALEKGILQRAGAWYRYGEIKLGQGLESVFQMIADNPDFYTELYNKVLESVNS